MKRITTGFIVLVLTLFVSAVSMAANKAPRYIFYFIGDGMGMGAVSVAQAYHRIALGNDSFLPMLTLDVASQATTHSASSPVTDSAAAGTALSTGSKTKNGMLGMNPDTVAVNSIAKHLHDAGYGVAILTSDTPDDATPGAFFTHVPHRSMVYEIGCDAARSGYEFIAGARLRGLKDRKTGELTDLLDVIAQNGVTYVKGLDALKNVDSRRVVLVTEDSVASWLPYAVDSVPGCVTLEQLTAAGLDHMKRVSPDRFFMMVECGAIDHAGHSNDPAASVGATLTLNNALDLALDFYKEHPDETLIVVTADHETGGMGLSSKVLHYDAHPEYLKHVKMSKDNFSDRCEEFLKNNNVPEWEAMRDTLSSWLGLYTHIPVSEADNEELHSRYVRTYELHNASDIKTLYHTFSEFAEEVFALISRNSGISWASHDHSGAIVPVYAKGVGAEAFSGMQDNIEIPKKILRIAGLEK